MSLRGSQTPPKRHPALKSAFGTLARQGMFDFGFRALFQKYALLSRKRIYFEQIGCLVRCQGTQTDYFWKGKPNFFGFFDFATLQIWLSNRPTCCSHYCLYLWMETFLGANIFRGHFGENGILIFHRPHFEAPKLKSSFCQTFSPHFPFELYFTLFCASLRSLLLHSFVWIGKICVNE